MTAAIGVLQRLGIASLTATGILTTFILRFNISPLGSILQKQLQITPFQFGLLASAFLWVYTFLQPFAGMVADRFGARSTLLVGVFLASIITVMTGFATSFLSLILLRVVLGITQAPNFVTGAKVSSSDWFNRNQRARATSAWIVGARLGTVITLPVSTLLAVGYGWQWAFFGTGFLGLLWCIVWYFSYQEEPKTEAVRVRPPTFKVNFRASLPIIASPLGVGLVMSSFGQGYIAYYLQTWLPTYLVNDQKYTVLNSGIFAALPILTALITILLAGGFLSDHLIKRGAPPVNLRGKLFAIGMAIVSIMILATAYAPNALLAITFLCLAGAAWGVSTPSLWAALVAATPKSQAGTVGGIQNLGGNLGGILVTVLTGYLLAVSGTFFDALLVASGMAMMAAISAALLIRSKARRELEAISVVEQAG